MMKSEKGQATVELALSLTVIMLLIFGMIDFGRIIYTYMTLEHASRESARIASVGAENTEIIDYAYKTAGTINGEDITVKISPEEGRVRGSYVTVTTSVSVKIFTPFLEKIISNPYTVTGETVMRVE